jgi:hypothetical protein
MIRTLIHALIAAAIGVALGVSVDCAHAANVEKPGMDCIDMAMCEGQRELWRQLSDSVGRQSDKILAMPEDTSAEVRRKSKAMDEGMGKFALLKEMDLHCKKHCTVQR